MSTLIWITPPGTVAVVNAGIDVSITVQAFDTSNLGLPIAYRVIQGELPSGLTMSNTGVISGTPVYTGTLNTINYQFVVRAITSDNAIIDGAFNITLNSTVINNLSWVTPAGNLGTVPDGEYYSLPLRAESAAGNNITYSFISGKLPPGMQIIATGALQGVPVTELVEQVNQSLTYKFTVRATDSAGLIRDQAFSLTVTNVQSPVIQPTTTFLGDVFDGSYYSQQLSVTELNSNAVITWELVNGTLPPGVTLGTTTGLISGFIAPIGSTTVSGPNGFDGETTTDGVVVDNQSYGATPYDFTATNQTLSYSFTVQAFDGANYDKQKYILSVISRQDWTADNNYPGGANDTYITVDSATIYTPVFLTTASSLPPARQNSHYAYQLKAYDYQNDAITFGIANDAGTMDAYVVGIDLGFDYLPFDDTATTTVSSSTNLPGLTLDATTGWIYGIVAPQSAAVTTYKFGVQLSKTHTGPVYWSANNSTTFGTYTVISPSQYFNLTVYGDVNNTINWVGTPDSSGVIALGTINNGAVSELSVSAINTEGAQLVYSLVDSAGISCALPQGLTLLSDGTISGRVSFETFTIDGTADTPTTFDSNKTGFDHTYKFFVQANTPNSNSITIQEFSIVVTVIDNRPYVNAYVHALPSSSERTIFDSIVTNSEIFNPQYLYRPLDPWFGVQSQLSMLFTSGLRAEDVDAFETAIALNHFTKVYNFGDIKTAVVLDDNFNVKYEVVYIEMLDPELNSKGNGPPLEINLDNIIVNPYIDANGNTFNVLYPNTSKNMLQRLINGIGYQDQNTLPPWMSSNQLGTSAGANFSPPLGYTRAVVLAYTKPNTSQLIAYRLKNANTNFNRISFKVDRYELDNYYASNYNFASNSFVTSTQTTFDSNPRSIGSIVATVNYAVDIPYSQINGRTVDYIVTNGGLDGVTTFNDGDTLIFYKQENFVPPIPYDVWVNYSDGYIGTNIVSGSVGYGSEAYDVYTTIPGYNENSQANDTFTGDGVSTQYRITQTVSNTNQVSVSVNGVVQSPTSYVVSGQLLTFNTAPANTIPAKSNATIAVYNGINEQSFTSNGTLSLFTLNSVITNTNSPLVVYVNGLQVSLANYSVTGSTLTFVTPPPQTQPANILPVISVISTTNTLNQRGGIWQINIVNNIVNLSFVQEITLNQRLEVIDGKTRHGSIVYYNPTLSSGATVPSYSTFVLTGAQTVDKTTFNNDTTRFYSYRDQYYTPGENAKYIKFPQYGAFN
jgi:hypothetical protein